MNTIKEMLVKKLHSKNINLNSDKIDDIVERINELHIEEDINIEDYINYIVYEAIPDGKYDEYITN